MMSRSIYVGFDPREAAAFNVARYSFRCYLTQPIRIRGLVLSQLQAEGLYRRPTRTRINSEGRLEMIDELSIRSDYNGRIATQHANARFLVPHLARTGWALFSDGDVLARPGADLARLFDSLDAQYACYCVKHAHQPTVKTKMDGQLQTQYHRKNWTSFIVWNCGHAAVKELTVEMVNTLPGRDLHALGWIDDDAIGALDPAWNHLVGEVPHDPDCKVAHFTNGTPDMPGYESQPFADEWRSLLDRQAA
jgi:hypothetical protein